MASLKAFLKTLIETKEKDGEEFEAYDLHMDMQFASLPQAPIDLGDDDVADDADDADVTDKTPTMEDIDFENNEILDINFETNTIKFAAGGDWQEPAEFTVTLQDDGFFHYNNDAIIGTDAEGESVYVSGLDTDDIINMVNQ